MSRIDDINEVISAKGLRPLGNRLRLTRTDDEYNVRLFLFDDRSDAERYYRAFVSFAERTPPPFPIEIMLVRIHTIYDQPYGLVFPYERTDTRPEYTAWFREANLTCNEVLRNFQPTDHSYQMLHRYVKELFDWTILVPKDFDLASPAAQAILSDPPEGGFTLLQVEGG